MKIEKWLGDPMNAVNGIALVVVEENEIADIEEMVILVDGDSVGNFGYSVHLEKVENEIGGVPNASTVKKSRRYYKVFVHRD